MEENGEDRTVKENGKLKASPWKGGNGSKDMMGVVALFIVLFRWSFSRYSILLFSDRS